ncbi:MAG: GFA family protein [Polyangiaceae bacterium]|nr:GFA family protein [Polyangiaceae bacterium]
MKELLAQLEGGCHCGRVRFRVNVRAFEALDCNCSICAKKGFLHLIVEKADFELLQGELSTYTFGTGVAKHTFCRTCGIHAFYTPRSHPDGVDVNVRCLDGDALARFVVRPFDGQKWEENVGAIQGR